MRVIPVPVLLALALLAPGCSVAEAALGKPSADDPHDGYDGHLAAGPSTSLDIGPNQESLLANYEDLRGRYADLEAQLRSREQELERLTNEHHALQKDLERERNEHAQTEAAYKAMSARVRDLQAKILVLGVRKAEQEQELLLLRIARIREALEEFERRARASEAAAQPPRGRGKL